MLSPSGEEFIFVEVLLNHVCSSGCFLEYEWFNPFVGSVVFYKDLLHCFWSLNTVNSFMSFLQFQFIPGTWNKSIICVYNYIQL